MWSVECVSDDSQVLPGDTNRPLVEPMMGRVIGPYVAGGGGMQNAMKNYNVNGGGFSQMTGDLVTAMRDVPFSIPPYFVRVQNGPPVTDRRIPEGIAYRDVAYRDATDRTHFARHVKC